MKLDKTKKALPFLLLLLLAIAFNACKSNSESSGSAEDQEKIKQVHADYIEAWKSMNQIKLMELLDEDVMIHPSDMQSIKGRKDIMQFWFPQDSSETKIKTFDTEILNLTIQDTLAIMTLKSTMDWAYRKQELGFEMEQQAIVTNLYRRQPDNNWKIWKSMWTDIKVKKK